MPSNLGGIGMAKNKKKYCTRKVTKHWTKQYKKYAWYKNKKKQKSVKKTMGPKNKTLKEKSKKSLKSKESFVKKKILKEKQGKKSVIKKGAIYCRTSTPTNKDKSGISRQQKAARLAAAKDKTKIVKNVVEIISGSLTMDKRDSISDLLTKTKDKDIEKVYVESIRAISRDANVAEAMFLKSQKENVQIVPADFPDLCILDPNPVQTFIRRVMFAMTELEKNLIAQRLKDGQQRKKEQAEKIVAAARANNKKLKVGQLTQEGKAKTCGSKSTLEAMGPLTKLQKKQFKDVASERDSKKIGLRKMQKKMSEILQKDIRSHETARRLAAEIMLYD